MNGQKPSIRQADLSLDFLIIGGSVSGLGCALALRRVGHRVTVIERDRSVEGDGVPSGHRLGPNGAKILYEWGYRAELERICSRSDGVFMLVYETGERLGKHIWNEEVLRETRGHWMYPRHDDLRRFLHRAAISLGAKIRYNTRATAIDPDKRLVTLATGEVLRAHVIIGADGPNGITRRYFPDADVFHGDPGSMKMYHTTIPRKAISRDPDLLQFLQPRDDGVLYTYAWFGTGHCAVAHPVQREETLALNVWVPRDGALGTWHEVASRERLLASVGDIEPRLRKLIKLGSAPKAMPLTGYHELENWVHDSGRLVLIGQAAHPLHHGSLQGTSLCLEDGAVLGKLFSHLRSEDQIRSFLNAFRDLRTVRCKVTSDSELGNVGFMTLPPGKDQMGRDMMLKQKDAAGLNVLTPDDDDESTIASERWEQVKFMFGYDCEDEADNWWIQWGRLAMHAQGSDMRNEPSGVSYHMNEMLKAAARQAQDPTRQAYVEVA